MQVSMINLHIFNEIVRILSRDRKLFSIFCLSLLLGCQSGNRKLKIDELPTIDLSKNYSEKKITLQSIADVEYVPLETTDDVLLGNTGLFYVSDNYILVRNSREGGVFIFNRSGKIISHFNHKGEGSQEYRSNSGVVFDEKNEEVFVLDFPSTARIQVYSIDGNHKRSLQYSENLRISAAYNFDEETILAYDENGLFQENYSETPYLLLSKADGRILSSLDIKLPVRYSNRFVRETTVNGQSTFAPVMIYFSNNRHFGQNFVIADMSSDTIYQLTKERLLTSFLIRTPSVHSVEPRTIWTCNLTTDKFVVLNKLTLVIENLESTNLIHEFETGQTSQISFVNEDFLSRDWFPDDVDIPQKNVAASLLDVTRLKDAYTEKRLGEGLEQLVATLEEDDNPVVMIVKFR
jgi:hypothetical protein